MKKKIILISLILIIALLLVSSNVFAVEKYVDQNNDASLDGENNIYNNAPIGQSFVPSYSSLGGVEVYLKSIGWNNQGNANITAFIRKGSISGPVIAESSQIVSEDFNGWLYFSFSSPVFVNPGATYVLQLGSNNLTHEWVHSGDLYSSGNLITVGADNLQFDTAFRTYALTTDNIASISMKTYDQTQYYGKSLDLTNTIVTATKVSGDTEDIPLTSDMVSGYDSTKLDAQTLSVMCGGATATFDVTVVDYAKGISIRCYPKLTYNYGEELNLTGGMLQVNNATGTTEYVNITTEMVSGYDMSILGSQIVTVTYDGATTFFEVFVEDYTDSIIMKTYPKQTYDYGEKLSVGGIITVVKASGDTEDVDISFDMVSGYDMTIPGTQTVTVTYDGKITTYDIFIGDPPISIEITNLPDKTNYIVEESLDLTGLVVMGNYSDGTRAVPIYLANISGFDSSKPVSDQIVTITVFGMTATFHVSIEAMPPYQTFITAGNDSSVNLAPVFGEGNVQAQTFVPTSTGYIKGVKIKLHPQIRENVITQAHIWSIDPATNLPDQLITGAAPIFTNSNTNLDDWTSFYFPYENQILLNAGTRYALVITLEGGGYGFLYNIQATSGDMYPDGEYFSGYYEGDFVWDRWEQGPAGCDLVFQVICREPPSEPVLNSLEITNLPNKTNYIVGESFDLTGLVVMGNYSDGTREVPITELTISGFDNSKPVSDQIVTIKVDGKTATFYVNIEAQPVTEIIVSGSGGTTNVVLNGTLQMTAEILPDNATDQSVTWSVNNGTGMATINSEGLLTGTQVGTVTVIATANDNSGVVGSLTVNVVRSLVSTITVSGEKNATIVGVNFTLQMKASVEPKNANTKAVSWEVMTGSGTATISDSGLLTGQTAGTITVVATAMDGSGIKGMLNVNVVFPVMGITVLGENDATTLAVNSSLKMKAIVSPAEATNQTVTWSVKNSSGRAIIDASGLLTGTKAGNVTVTATANDGSVVKGSITITITK